MLSVLSHTLHTLITRIPHTPAPQVDNLDGNTEDDEAEHPGGESEVLEGGTTCNVSGDFDFEEFYDLATRVLNGDSESMANLKSLKVRWEQKFKTRNPALKSVTGTDPLPEPNVEHSNILVGGSTSLELDTHGCSSSPIGTGFPRPGATSTASPQNCDAQAPLDLASFPSHEEEPQETPIPQISGPPAKLPGELAESVLKVNRIEGPSRNNQDSSPILEANPPSTGHDGLPAHADIYIGNVKLRSDCVDNIAGAFLQSTRKTLHFVPPTRQNGEIIIRPTKEVVDNGSKKWQSTAVGYFLGRRPYFPQLETIAMEDVIEGGPWLFQGQPIVLQAWEQGMSLRRQKHTQIPVWIRLKHLPMEYWTDEGLSTVASGIGTPLYSDGITKDCSRLDFARVCVMLDFNSELPKHLVVISPVLRDGKEDPKRIDVEYEWLPQRCKNCCSLGHVSATCPTNMKKNVAPPITIFVKNQSTQLVSNKPEQSLRSIEDLQTAASSGMSGINKGKDIVLYNSYSALDTDFPKDAEQIVAENDLSMGPKDSSPVVGGS
ncbi:UNVERIFIED_CONTAM: hypothetical protein Scaly_2911000 [Sesamum calycinum]|uniref:DUF4283 domain-containing protein n=1 Tax=Sesamum calycinum TaxID=2727403 RepID=A0AAW2L340_9LAMI